MPFLNLDASPLAPGVSPVLIHYREHGSGFPLVFLHGGWGYEVYPFDAQIDALATDFRVLIPDRTGYGRSTRVTRFARPFHAAGARETLAVLDALGIERAVLWGHSDGAVMAANAALFAPSRVAALILEATHYDRRKPRSREFFGALVTDPETVGPRVASRLKADHGEEHWRQVLAMEGEVWVEILDGASDPAGDLFGGRLGALGVPALLLHGADDPRTEPGELDALHALVPQSRLEVLKGGGHSPHFEKVSFAECARQARLFLKDVLV